MEEGRLRRKDTTKGPPLRILSLDGGGVRGYSMLIILQELMHRTFVEIEGRAPKRHEIPKPCDHFDLIAGTGTGGLIAIMLGRLRLDIDTCKEVYTRMTRRVFQTDKTIAGIPYKRTLFKASMLEEAIKECVREHTIFEDEGNDVLANATPMSASAYNSNIPDIPQRSMSQSSRYSQIGMSPAIPRSGISMGTKRWGNPNSLLYDARENRTKTAVTAVFKGKSGAENTVLLRSYDSRKEPADDSKITIWQSGRATCATGLAFKPIQIGQSVYHDDGSGKYNPSPSVLDEAVQNEWPGREVGVFVSIGTGKRPNGTSNSQQDWWENFLGSSMGDFAEARRRLIAKIEGCEDTHRLMLREHLGARGVNPENYYRFNVEVGVGEFGMNEWNRLSDISTNTRMYLSKDDVQRMNLGASAKMARICLAKIRQDRAEARRHGPESGQTGADPQHNWQNPWDRPLPGVPEPSNPMAVELPGDEPTYAYRPQRPQYEHRPSIADQKYTVIAGDEHARPATADVRQSYQNPSSPYQSPTYPPRSSFSYNNSNEPTPRPSMDSYHHPSPPPTQSAVAGAPPPLPPKTPLPYPDSRSPGAPLSATSPTNTAGPRTFMNMGDLGRMLPYPDVDGPPPVVNTANKPQIMR